MANEQNLRPGEYQFTQEDHKKGAANSAKARRRKADLRKMAQAILDGTYKDKNGKEVTGMELVINSMLANIADPKSKNWNKAVDLLVELTGAKRTPEEIERIKAETELLKAKAKLMVDSDDSEAVNDGFIAALEGSAASDWATIDE